MHASSSQMNFGRHRAPSSSMKPMSGGFTTSLAISTWLPVHTDPNRGKLLRVVYFILQYTDSQKPYPDHPFIIKFVVGTW